MARFRTKSEAISFCKKMEKKRKSNIIIFIDKNGNKRWKFKSKKGAIYGK